MNRNKQSQQLSPLFKIRGNPDALTFSALQTSTDTFANSADPDETARYEPSHQDLHCLPFYHLVLTVIPIRNNGCVQS